jgi:hypothetical protein
VHSRDKLANCFLCKLSVWCSTLRNLLLIKIYNGSMACEVK